MAEETAVTPKIKTRKPKQRACDEKDEKGYGEGEREDR